MGKLCFLCKRSPEEASTRSYHLFPSDSIRRTRWFQAVGLEYVNTKSIYLCSDHFPQEAFVTQPSGRRILTKGATPSDISWTSQIDRECTSTSSSDESSSLNTRPEIVTDVNQPVEVVWVWDTTEQLQPATEPVLEASVSPSTSATKSATESVEDEVISIERSPTDASSATTAPPKHQQEQPTMSSDTLQESVQPKPKKRKVTQPRYVGDVKIGDLVAPGAAERSWELAKKTILLQKHKIKSLQQQNRRLKARVECFKSLVKHLTQKKVVTPKNPQKDLTLESL